MAVEIWDLVNDNNEVIGECLAAPYDEDAAGEADVFYYVGEEPNYTWYTWDGMQYNSYTSFIGHRPKRRAI